MPQKDTDYTEIELLTLLNTILWWTNEECDGWKGGLVREGTCRRGVHLMMES